ncbi:MAG: hypothetical protein ACK4MD_08835 [Demequina sp.]
MTKQTKWSLTSAGTGALVAVLLVVVFDVPVPSAMIILGLWIIAGAALRIFVEYLRLRREAVEAPDVPEA